MKFIFPIKYNFTPSHLTFTNESHILHIYDKIYVSMFSETIKGNYLTSVALIAFNVSQFNVVFIFSVYKAYADL